ncbi:4'-phosphopantetheinyl transferase [Pseudohyphozyma bogoriensis]|nr:4'-phosphopantetheinyl transferase [Pseudohyphozyma bogoriensis]
MPQILTATLKSAFPAAPATSLPPHESLAPLLHLLDADSAAKIAKFRLLEDAQRCCLGRLMTRYLLSSKLNLPWSSHKFAQTPAGRPYAVPTSPTDTTVETRLTHERARPQIHRDLPLTFDFNLSHDSAYVVLAYSKTHKVGVDVMRVKIPWEGETVNDFVDSLEDQLSLLERRWLKTAASPEVKLRRVFALWTLKEAYTKALGLGMGFDFAKISFRFPHPDSWDGLEATNDGVSLSGWKFGVLSLHEAGEEHLVGWAVQTDQYESVNIAPVEMDDILKDAETSLQSMK